MPSAERPRAVDRLGVVERLGGVERRGVAERLARAGCVAADEEADALLAAAPDETTLQSWVARRAQGEPLAWIVGCVRFAGITLLVDPGVFVPRAQTEELAVRAAGLLPERGRAADLCTGSGAVAAYLSAMRPAAYIVGTDLDRAAVACARRNGVAAIVTDMGLGLASCSFDLVTAVTPYVPSDEMRLLPPDVVAYEPAIALDGGTAGMQHVRRLVATSARLLRRGGWLLTEIGGDQDVLVGPVLAAAGFGEPAYWCDGEGDLRGVIARLRP